MTKTIKSFWDLLEEYCTILNDKGFQIVLHKEKYEEYKKAVQSRYEKYKTDYMVVSKVENLDRHKTAAILVTQGLDQHIIGTSNKVKDGQIDIGAQKVLLLCAFDYMLAMINYIIRERNSSLEPIKSFCYPQAWACKTNYIDIISRSLYYAQKDYKLNDMELAEKFFLLEYITVLKTCGENAARYFKALEEDLH